MSTPETILEWRRLHPEKIREYNRRYRETHLEQYREYQRNYHRAMRAKKKEKETEA